jgi:hypothetical protein
MVAGYLCESTFIAAGSPLFLCERQYYLKGKGEGKATLQLI